MVHAARRVPSSIIPLVCLGALLLLGACSRESGDWKSAQGADTIEAYDGFLKQHPQSEFAAQALERTKQLAEEREWQAATQADTADAYQQFLTQYPEGKWAQEARVRIENFNVMDGGAAPIAASTPAPAPAPAPAPTATPSAPATEPVVAPVAKPAIAKPAIAKPAMAKPAATEKSAPAGGKYRVQLGAFSSEETARAEWRRASGRFAELKSLSPLVTAVQTGSGTLFRLQAALTSEASARDLCARLKAGGQACIYVPGR